MCLCAVRQVMRDLLLSIQLAADTDRQPSQQQQVLVSSRAALPAGLRLCSDALAAGSNAQQLLLDQGPAALAAAAADASKAPSGSSSSSVEGSGVLRHVYELMLLPPEGDPLRDRKLQLLSATGLGLCHYLTDCQKGALDNSNSNSSSGAETEQQQQESARAVLSAMALCLLSAEDPVHVQLLSPDRIQAVAQEQQRLLRAAGVLGTSAVSAGAVLDASTEAAATDASTPWAGGDGLDSSRVWAELQKQVLQQTGKEARKQLLLVLKEDKKAAKAAQQEPQQQEEEEQAAGDGQCCCCGGGAASAAQGVGVYLVGQVQVLHCWVGLLQASGLSSSGSKKSKKKEAAAEDGRKKHKKQKKAVHG